MRPEDFELLYKLEERYWWFVAMRHITDTILREPLRHRGLRVLDAGCGTGFNLQHYTALGQVLYGIDIDPYAIDAVRRRGFDRVVQASVTALPFAPGIFDMVFSFDVLQQLPVDSIEPGLRELHRVLKPGGILFIRVAAFEWLRSSHDEELGTVHRFTRREMVRRLTNAGFQPEWHTYANSFLFPVAFIRRLLKRAGIGGGTDVKPLPAGLAWLDPIFRWVLTREASVFGLGFSLPFGLSVICYARKQSR